MAKDKKHEDFAEVLNNVKFITLGQIFKIIKKIKYSAALTLFAIFSSCTSGAYVAGQYTQQKDTAVMLETPFAMRLQLGGRQYEFTNLTLLKDPMVISVSNDKIILSLREIRNDFDIIPLGKVIATTEEKDISFIWKFILGANPMLSEAYAQPIQVFNWNGHNGDYRFKEAFENEHTVYRYYSDGCILSYEVNSARRSIPESFRWIERTH